MTQKASQPATEHYIVAARQLSGTPDSSLGAVVQVFIATPTFSWASARASFVPSAGIASSLPSACSRLSAILSSGFASARKSSTRFAGDLRSTDRVSPVTSRFATGRTYGPGAVTTWLGKLALRAAADEVRDKARIQRGRESMEPTVSPEQVMVCMSSNALAPRVRRMGARIAGRLGSRWYAVYVETPRERADRINPGDAEALQQNIKLAETLGATVVRVKADKPADGLIAFAQREGVTHVIFGQTARTRWELLLRGSALDRFLGAVPDAAVHVVPFNER